MTPPIMISCDNPMFITVIIRDALIKYNYPIIKVCLPTNLQDNNQHRVENNKQHKKGDIMRTFENDRVGLRNKETGQLIAVFPDKVTGNMDTVKKEVFDWYYKTSCSAEEVMRNCIVDDLSEHELKGLGG